MNADISFALYNLHKELVCYFNILFSLNFSYAGLHCVEIKGHSKSVGYEPGMKIQSDMFQNTWNAVLIDGDWRLVQCNWGAR